MLHRGRHEPALDDRRPEHLGDRVLVEHALLLTFHRQADIYATALGRRNLDAQTLLGEVNLTRICRIELNRGSFSSDLQGE